MNAYTDAQIKKYPSADTIGDRTAASRLAARSVRFDQVPGVSSIDWSSQNEMTEEFLAILITG